MKIQEEVFEQVTKDSYFKLSLEEKNKIKDELERMLLKFEILNEFDGDMKNEINIINNLDDKEYKDNQFDPNLLTNDIYLNKSEYFALPQIID